MRPEKLLSFLTASIKNGRRILIKGMPGIGKTDIVDQARNAANADMVLMHPAISDPTDFKGMPALTAGGKEAHFLPFGDLSRLCKANSLTVAMDGFTGLPTEVGLFLTANACGGLFPLVP